MRSSRRSIFSSLIKVSILLRNNKAYHNKEMELELQLVSFLVLNEVFLCYFVGSKFVFYVCNFVGGFELGFETLFLLAGNGAVVFGKCIFYHGTILVVSSYKVPLGY